MNICDFKAVLIFLLQVHDDAIGGDNGHIGCHVHIFQDIDPLEFFVFCLNDAIIFQWNPVIADDTFNGV